MPNHRRERVIHNALLHHDTRPFDQWKQEGKDPSYFHKRIIEYEYDVRYHIFMNTGRYREYFPIKVKHRGWPLKNPMTPQAWTIMELLAGLQIMEYPNGEIPDDLYYALLFISTGILRSEIHEIWEELLNTVYVCTEQKADMWVAIFHCTMTGLQNHSAECEIQTPSRTSIKVNSRTFLNRIRKIQLLREFFYNRKEAFDHYIQWLYRGESTPLILRYLFSLERIALEHTNSLLPAPPLPSRNRVISSYRPQSPLEQSEPLDSVSSLSSHSEESL